jgi:hypothetical protein
MRHPSSHYNVAAQGHSLFRPRLINVAIERIGEGKLHQMAARRIISGGLPLMPEQAAHSQFDLRKLALRTEE